MTSQRKVIEVKRNLKLLSSLAMRVYLLQVPILVVWSILHLKIFLERIIKAVLAFVMSHKPFTDIGGTGQGDCYQQSCEEVVDRVHEESDVNKPEHKINKTRLKQSHLKHWCVRKKVPVGTL